MIAPWVIGYLLKELTRGVIVFQEVFEIVIVNIPLIKLVTVLLLATVILRFNLIFIPAKRKITMLKLLFSNALKCRHQYF